jgi:hypothetical protein
MAVDFAAVMWARRMSEALEGLRRLGADDLGRLLPLIQGVAEMAKQGTQLSDAQLTVILQHLSHKTLMRIEADKGGVLVEFSGESFEYERFLVRADGRVPNNRYEARRVMRDT